MLNYSNTHIIIIDVYNGIKEIVNEKWFNKVIESNNGIWLGVGITSQAIFKVNIKPNDKGLNFPYMGYIIDDTKYQVIKYVINRVVEDEE